MSDIKACNIASDNWKAPADAIESFLSAGAAWSGGRDTLLDDILKLT
ncbi:MAG: hypothetical protein IPO30_13420 [Hyphomonadaceae bacterium]|nr:hypothetical protein [Hyphomonadaceae bacterium]MBP9234222.1 hypothetical protein [Hyphomonadaceae bacterium]